MESSQIIQDFASNVKGLASSNSDEQKKAIVWMLKFIRTEDVFTMCCQMLKSSLGDDIILHSIKVLQKKIQCTHTHNYESDLLKIYHFFLDYLKKTPSAELTIQIFIVIANLFEKTDAWKRSLPQMIEDILLIVPEPSNTSDDLFPQKAAVIFMKELLSDVTKPHYFKNYDLWVKINDQIVYINQILAVFFKNLGDDPYYLNMIFNIFEKTSRFDSQYDIVNWSFYVHICKYLQNADPEKPETVLLCVRFVDGDWWRQDMGNEDKYRLYLPVAKGLRRCIEPAIRSKNYDLVYSISRLVAKLGVICFRSYTDSNIESDYTFLDVLTYICEYNDLHVYDAAIHFWSQFENKYKYSEPKKTDNFVKKYCDIFLKQMMKASFLSQPMRDQCSKGQVDDFVVELWKKVRPCLTFISKIISFEPYLKRAIKIIRSHPDDFSQIEPSLYFVSAMISAEYQKNSILNEVYEFILTISPDAPSLSIQTSCEFLTNFIRNRQKSNEDDGISFYSISKWLTGLPIFASLAPIYDSEYDEDMFDDVISACGFLNRMLILCQENNQIRSLVRVMRDETAFASMDNKLNVFKSVYEFFLNAILQKIQNNQNTSDSARFTVLILAEMTSLLEKVQDNFPNYTYSETIENVFDMCFLIFEHFKDDNEVLDKTSDVMCFLIGLAKGFYPYLKILWDKLVQSYQTLNLSCFLGLFDVLLKFYYNVADSLIILEQGFNYMTDKYPNHDPIYSTRLLKFFRSMLQQKYDDVLVGIDIGRLVSLSSDALLSENESIFNEYREILSELFERSSISGDKNRQEKDFAATRLYRKHSKQIVKNCVDVILSQRKTLFVEGCGMLLQTVNSGEKRVVGQHVKITQGLVSQMLKNHPLQIGYDLAIRDRFLDLINSSGSEEASYIATEINFELYGC